MIKKSKPNILVMTISGLLLLFLLVFLNTLWSYIGNSKLQEAYSQDISIMFQIQAYKIKPMGNAIAFIYLVWGILLLFLKMRKSKWLFFSLSLLVYVTTILAFPLTGMMLINSKSANETKELHANKENIENLQNDAWRKIKNIQKMSIEDAYATLKLVPVSHHKELIPVWRDYAKRVINEWPSDKNIQSKEYYLGWAGEALEKEYGSMEALKAIQEIERALDETKTHKTKMMYSKLIYIEGKLINPPFRILDETDENYKFLMQAYEAYQKRFGDLVSYGNTLELGDKMTQSGQYDEALKQYHAALESKYIFTDAEKSESKERVVRTLLLLGRYEEALENWKWFDAVYKRKESFEIKKSQIEALIQYRKTGNPKIILDFINQYEQKIKQSGLSYGLLRANVIFMYDVIGAYDEGIAYMDEEISGLRKYQVSHGKDGSIFDQVTTSVEAKGCVDSKYSTNRNPQWRTCEILYDKLRIREAFNRSKITKNSGNATNVLLQTSKYYLLSL